jgi:hypothetical protein
LTLGPELREILGQGGFINEGSFGHTVVGGGLADVASLAVGGVVSRGGRAIASRSGESGRGALRVLTDAELKIPWGGVLDPNKLHHIFGNPAHNLGPVVAHFGSQGAAGAALEIATQAAITAGSITGKFQISIVLGGMNATVRGVVINGVARIGTAFR